MVVQKEQLHRRFPLREWFRVFLQPLGLLMSAANGLGFRVGFRAGISAACNYWFVGMRIVYQD